MAGDWIKVEAATINKPEVGMFAELLGIPVDQGFGLLIRFWMWMDANSRDGRVTHVSHLSVDTNMHTVGFAAALEAVGWLNIDKEAHVMTIPNFDRHNGNTAKSRSLHARRQAKLRDARVTLDASPREEKRRVSTSLRSVDVPRATRVDSFALSAEDLNFASKEAGWSPMDCEREFQAFRDYWAGVPASKGLKTDWAGTWRNFVRREKKFATKAAGKETRDEARSRVAREMYGSVLREINERDNAIDAEAVRVG